MTTTIITWITGSLTTEQSAEINDHAEQMHLAGKTNGEKEIIDIDNTTQVTRTWTTLTDAEEWMLFVEEYNPVSATIQS
jgi:hypothetical protein